MRARILFAAAAYCIAGLVAAVLAADASTSGAVKAWRLAAWLLSLGVFALHFVVERRKNPRVAEVAMRVALGVALGALALAALGPVRTHWGEPSRLKLIVLSLVAWPLLAGLPAFLVALLGGRLLDRTRAAR